MNNTVTINVLIWKLSLLGNKIHHPIAVGRMRHVQMKENIPFSVGGPRSCDIQGLWRSPCLTWGLWWKKRPFARSLSFWSPLVIIQLMLQFSCRNVMLFFIQSLIILLGFIDDNTANLNNNNCNGIVWVKILTFCGPILISTPWLGSI